MLQASTRWPPYKVEAMRRELLEEGKTLKQIGEREGVSGEWIRQLVGNLNRGDSHSRAMLERITALVESGLSDQEIAEATGLSIQRAKIYRLKTGFHRENPRKKWTPELILQKARGWFERYGYVLGAADWNPALAIRQGAPERARRFYEFGAPHAKVVQYHFRSWSEMLRRAGFPPNPEGEAGHGRYKR